MQIRSQLEHKWVSNVSLLGYEVWVHKIWLERLRLDSVLLLYHFIHVDIWRWSGHNNFSICYCFFIVFVDQCGASNPNGFNKINMNSNTLCVQTRSRWHLYLSIDKNVDLLNCRNYYNYNCSVMRLIFLWSRCANAQSLPIVKNYCPPEITDIIRD